MCLSKLAKTSHRAGLGVGSEAPESMFLTTESPCAQGAGGMYLESRDFSLMDSKGERSQGRLVTACFV